MATLPADRTKLALAQSNQNPSNVLGSSQNKNALTEAYDTIDLLYGNMTGLISAAQLSKLGIINVIDYNASGSAQTTTGSITTGTNILTLATALDFKNGQGINVNGKTEVDNLQITAAATVSSNVTVTLNGVAFTVAVLAGDTIAQVATKIRAATYAGWTTGGATDTIIFTSTSTGVRTTQIYSAGTTGATGTMTITTQGSADLITTISSGGGTTTLTLAVSASTTVSSITVNHDDTAAIQSAINSSLDGSTITFPRGTYNITSITINKPLFIYGAYKTGSTFGVQGTGGTILKGTSQTLDMIKIDATGLPNNKGLSVSIERLTIIGNANVAGATAGSGVNLIGDQNGQTFFVEGCLFTDVHIRDTKGYGWLITGTVFSNEWYSCSTYNTGSHGVYHNKGANGAPINNNFYNCKFFNAATFGFHSNGGKCTLIGCNISQNLGGGLYQSSGYMIISDCYFEANTGTQIELHSSSPSTRISGGMITKSPGQAAATGITIDNLCLGINVNDILFANYDNANDRLFTSSGGSFNQFNVRQQNCLSSSLPVANYQYIADPTFHQKIQTGSVLMTGSGVSTRVQTITFPKTFEQSYTVTVSVDTSAPLTDPSKVIASVDYDTQTVTQIRLRLAVLDATYGNVRVYYTAIGV